MFQFYGANRTGRYSGRIIQLQNLPQNHMPDLAQARELVKEGDFDALAMLYEDIPDTLSQLIRTAFVPQDGRRFIVADFSAIEARVIAWITGERWRLKVFEGGGDIYCASASQMFHVPVEKTLRTLIYENASHTPKMAYADAISYKVKNGYAFPHNRLCSNSIRVANAFSSPLCGRTHH